MTQKPKMRHPKNNAGAFFFHRIETEKIGRTLSEKISIGSEGAKTKKNRAKKPGFFYSKRFRERKG